MKYYSLTTREQNLIKKIPNIDQQSILLNVSNEEEQKNLLQLFIKEDEIRNHILTKDNNQIYTYAIQLKDFDMTKKQFPRMQSCNSLKKWKGSKQLETNDIREIKEQIEKINKNNENTSKDKIMSPPKIGSPSEKDEEIFMKEAQYVEYRRLHDDFAIAAIYTFPFANLPIPKKSVSGLLPKSTHNTSEKSKKTKDEITLDEFEETYKEFICEVSKQIKLGRQYQQETYKKLSDYVGSELTKKQKYTASNNIDVNFELLRESIYSYLDKNMQNSAIIEPFVEGTNELKENFENSTKDESYQKHLLSWTDTLDKSVTDAQTALLNTIKKVNKSMRDYLGQHEKFLNLLSSQKMPPLHLQTFKAIKSSYFKGDKYKREYGEIAPMRNEIRKFLQNKK